MTKSIASIFCSIFLSIFLVGCSTFGPSCLKTSLVTEESTAPLSRAIKGDTRVVTISAFKAGCGGSNPQLPGKEGDIGINLTLTAPEATHAIDHSKTVAFPLFVALLNKDDNVIDRRDETIVVRVSRDPLIHTHQITYHPPSGIDVESEDYRVLVGFNGNPKLILGKHHAKPKPKLKPKPTKGKPKRKKRKKGSKPRVVS